MKPFLTGSAPVLVLGGSPAGIVCAEILTAHGIPVTLVGEARPFGGRGRPAFGNKPDRPVWPFGFSHVPTTLSHELTHLLAKAHARGACVQPDDQVRAVVVKGQRVVEVQMEGVMGMVRRRPRFVVVASRGDHFLEMCHPKDELPKNVKGLDGTFKDEWVFHLTWPNLQTSQMPAEARLEVEGWECLYLSEGGRKGGLHWACRPFDSAGSDKSIDDAKMLTPHLLAALGVRSEALREEPRIETRIVRDATLQYADERKSSGKSLESLFSNVAFLGQSGSLTSMTVDEEMGDARAVVNKWLSG